MGVVADDATRVVLADNVVMIEDTARAVAVIVLFAALLVAVIAPGGIGAHVGGRLSVLVVAAITLLAVVLVFVNGVEGTLFLLHWPGWRFQR